MKRDVTMKAAINKLRLLFIKNDKPACKNDDTGCCYWLSNKPWGCAVGCLMTPADRKRIQEKYRHGVSAIFLKNHEELPNYLTKLPAEFLSRIQIWHDVFVARKHRDYTLKQVEGSLNDIAVRFKVN